MTCLFRLWICTSQKLTFLIIFPDKTQEICKAMNRLHYLLKYLIASIWLINGLLCKVLGMVPRHQQIVERILQTSHSRQIIFLIGLSEVGMALWILSGLRSRLNAVVQAFIISCMNILEFLLAPDLLLWGRLNLLFALLLIAVVIFNEFMLSPTPEFK